MVYSPTNTKELFQGKKFECDSCKKGILLPQYPNIPLEQNSTFICDNCGKEIHFVKKLKLNR
jgi:predicted RNA-binding Zn-ribbon protein involved in translation (DUF1610 family)